MWKLCSSTLATMIFVTLCIVCTLPIFALTCAVSILLFTIKHRNKLIAGLILWFILNQCNLQVFAEMVEQTTISFCNWIVYFLNSIADLHLPHITIPHITIPQFELSIQTQYIIKFIAQFAVYVIPILFLVFMLCLSISVYQIGLSPYKIIILCALYISLSLYGIFEYDNYVPFIVTTHAMFALFKMIISRYDFYDLMDSKLIIIYIMEQFNQSIKDKSYTQYEVYKMWNEYINELIDSNNKVSLHGIIISIFTLNNNYYITNSALEFIKRNIARLGIIRKCNDNSNTYMIDYSNITNHTIWNLR